MDELGIQPIPPPLPQLPAILRQVEAKPQVWLCFVLFGIEMAVTLAVGMTIGGVLMVLHRDEAIATNEALIQYYGAFLATIPGLLSTTPTGLAALGMAIGAAIFSKMPWQQRLRLRPGTGRWWVCIPSLIGILALGQTMTETMQLCGIAPGPALTVLATAFASLTGASLVVAVAVIGVLAGTAEELFFRGYIQSRFQQRWGPLLAILLTSVLFGILHLDLVHSPLAMGLGVYLGYLAVRTGSVRLPIFVHVMNNTMSVLLAAGHGETASTLGTLAFCLLLLAVSVLLIHIGTRPQSIAPIQHPITQTGGPSAINSLDEASLP